MRIPIAPVSVLDLFPSFTRDMMLNHDRRIGRAAHVCGFALAITLLLLAHAFAQTNSSAGHAYFTRAQADAGKATFEQTCAICHGDNLQGGVGAALAGRDFLSVSQYQGLTAEYIYHFISTNMPQNAPGSLTKTQYLDLTAYILSFNGYAAGSTSLTADTNALKAIKIEPQPTASAASQKSQQ